MDITKLKRGLIIALNIFWAALILVLLLIHLDEDSMLESGLDKLGHAILFGGMAFLLMLLINRFSTLSNAVIYTIAILAITSFGAIMEILQYELGWRKCDIFDLIADVAGAVIVCIFFPQLHRFVDRLLPYILPGRKSSHNEEISEK